MKKVFLVACAVLSVHGVWAMDKEREQQLQITAALSAMQAQITALEQKLDHLALCSPQGDASSGDGQGAVCPAAWELRGQVERNAQWAQDQFEGIQKVNGSRFKMFTEWLTGLALASEAQGKQLAGLDLAGHEAARDVQREQLVALQVAREEDVATIAELQREVGATKTIMKCCLDLVTQVHQFVYGDDPNHAAECKGGEGSNYLRQLEKQLEAGVRGKREGEGPRVIRMEDEEAIDDLLGPIVARSKRKPAPKKKLPRE